MEFKVWVDGIQRVISGVNSETTCRDIVLCLAQATHQFGKFVLIEKWRNNERLLAPNESPLQLLNKWADYGNEVCFIMRRSDYHQQLQQLQQHQQQQSKLQHGQAIPSSNSAPAISSKSANAQTGFAAQSNPNHLNPTHSDLSGQQPMQTHLQLPNVVSLRHSPAHVYGYTGSAKSVLNGGGHSPMQQQNKFVPINSRNNPHLSATARMMPAPQQQHIVPVTAVNENDSSDESSMYRPKRPPPYTVAITKSSLMQNGNSTKPSQTSSPGFYQQQPSMQLPNIYSEQVQGSSTDYATISGINHKAGNEIYGEIGLPPVLSNRSFNGNDVYGKNQIYDSRTSSELSEKRLADQRTGKKYVGLERGVFTDVQTHANNFTNFPPRSWNDNEVAKLTAREQFVINDELELLQREKKRIEMEKNQLSFNLNETDSKIAKCRQRIQQLMDEIKGKFHKKYFGFTKQLILIT